jgi:hypothetical protein
MKGMHKKNSGEVANVGERMLEEALMKNQYSSVIPTKRQDASWKVAIM